MDEALTSLAERLEGAEGGSERLSAEAMCVIAAPAGAYVEQSPHNGAWCIYEADYRGRKRLWERRGLSHRPDGWDVTRSLDAIAALIAEKLPGWEWTVGSYGGTRLNLGNDREVLIKPGKCATPALALAAALLRALSGSEP